MTSDFEHKIMSNYLKRLKKRCDQELDEFVKYSARVYENFQLHTFKHSFSKHSCVKVIFILKQLCRVFLMDDLIKSI